MRDEVVSSALTPPQQAAARGLLLAEREEGMARLASLTRDFEGIIESSASAATDDEHDPEGATVAFERAQVMTLIDQVRERLADLDDAFDRLRDGSYGVCERCGRPIGAERLTARPAARTCFACAAAAARPR
jgi:DnaK suppressor protein